MGIYGGEPRASGRTGDDSTPAQARIALSEALTELRRLTQDPLFDGFERALADLGNAPTGSDFGVDTVRKLRFRVYLKGRLWKCICGHWCFNVGFTAIGDGRDFNLSDVLPDPSVLQIKDWRGCDRTYIDFTVPVPGGRIPAEHCGTVYDVAAWFELRCCGYCEDKDSHLAVAGYESLHKYQFV